MMNTISTTLALAAGGALVPLRVLSSHQHALNLVTPTGTLFAIVTPYHGNGPFHIVISPAQLAQIQRQPTLYLRENSLISGSLTLPLTHFTRWEPHLPALITLPTQSLPALYQRYRELGQPALGVVVLGHSNQPTTKPLPILAPTWVDHPTHVAYQRAQQAMTALSLGLYEQKRELIIEGVTLLAGLGPGLTPAGDDFLVGVLAAFYALGPDYAQQQWITWQNHIQLIADTASHRTTRLSATWLTYAGGGAFGEPWHQLCHAINAKQSQALLASATRILTTGATSGADALSGFLWGMAVLERRVTG